MTPLKTRPPPAPQAGLTPRKGPDVPAVTAPVVTGLGAVTGRGECRDRPAAAVTGPRGRLHSVRAPPRACEDMSQRDGACRDRAEAGRDRKKRRGRGRAALSRHDPGYRAGVAAPGKPPGPGGCPTPGKAAAAAWAEPGPRWRLFRHIPGAAEPSLQGRSPAARPASRRRPLASLRRTAVPIGPAPRRCRRLRAPDWAARPSVCEPAFPPPHRPRGRLAARAASHRSAPPPLPHWRRRAPITPRPTPPRPLPYGVSLRARAAADWPPPPPAPPSRFPIGHRPPRSPSPTGRGGGGGAPPASLPPPPARPRFRFAAPPVTRQPAAACYWRIGRRGRAAGPGPRCAAPSRGSPLAVTGGVRPPRQRAGPARPSSPPPRRRSGSPPPGHHER